MTDADPPDAPASASPSAEHPALAALRARGAPRIDPIRWRFIEALSLRADAHHGAARRVLDDKLASSMHALDARIDRSGSPAAAADRSSPAATPPRSAFAELLDHVARERAQAASDSSAMAPEAAAGQGSATDAAQTLQFFRRTWSRLSADQRLAQSQSSLPQNAGPLNSQHLVHRALVLMREISPHYVDRLISYADALLWLEQANEREAQALGLAPRANPSARKSGSHRRG